MSIKNVTAIAACVAILAGSLPHSAPAQTVAMFRGNAAHTGIYDGPAVTGSPRVKWAFHAGGKVISSPALAGGLVFAGSTNGNLYAVDAATGIQKWKFPTGSRVVSSPAISDGAVYFESYDGNFYAVDATAGTLKWKFATGGERRYAGTHLHGILPKAETMPDPFDFYLSSAALWNGAVYFGSGDGNVYALDAATGALKWKFATGDVVHASPAIADGMLFIGSWDSYFYALDATTGGLKWRFKTGEDPDIHNQIGIQSSAAVVDGVVYFGCRDSHLYAVDEKTGVQRWARDTKGSWVIGSPAVRDGKVYAATSDTALFFVLDAKTGAERLSLDFKHWPMFSSPAVVGNFAYIGSHTGKLFAIDLSKGSVAWEFATEGAKTNGPIYTNADGTPNYAAAFPGSFYDDLIVGVSKMISVGAVLSSPVVAGGVIYFGSTDGNLYALTD